jgi:hypothetical protein
VRLTQAIFGFSGLPQDMVIEHIVFLKPLLELLSHTLLLIEFSYFSCANPGIGPLFLDVIEFIILSKSTVG